tara:strand:+ start:547 stop:1428 length:882 start_codon:yes stop_codon:yes gene_type:complete
MVKKIINIIASFRNEEENILYFCKNIDQAFKKYKKIDYRIYFINDFSTDSSEKKIINLKNKNNKIFLSSTKKHYGGSPSIHHGFELIPKDQFATVMDCDLQDPPSVLAKEFNLTDKNTLINFVRKEREENPFQLFYTGLAYKFISFVSKGKIISNSNYFKIIPPQIVKKIKKSHEILPFWNYFICNFSTQNKNIYYRRKLRVFGKSKYNIFSLNPWITFYSALYYFKLKAYLTFIFLIFLNYLILVTFDNFRSLSIIFGLTIIIQITNIFFYTTINLIKFFIKRPKVISRLYK